MLKPYIFLVLTTLIYAANILVGKIVTAEMPPLALTFIRTCIAVIIMLPFGLKELKGNLKLWKKEWKIVLTMSLLGIVLFNVILYFSVAHTSSINAGIIQGTNPIFAMLLGFFFLNERLNKLQIFGVLLSLLGVLLIITKGSLAIVSSLGSNIGDITMVLAMACWATYSIFVRKHNWKFPVYGGVLVLLMIGTVFLFPLALLDLDQAAQINWSWSLVFGLLFVGIFPSVLAFMFWNNAVAKIGPSRSAVFLNLVPIFTAIGAIFFLGESISLMQVLGGIVVLLGVILSNKEKAFLIKKVEVSQNS